MMRVIALVFSLAAGVAAMGQEPPTPEEKAESAVLKLGGEVTRDEKRPGRPVLGVEMNNPEVTDAGMKDLKQALPNVKILGSVAWPAAPPAPPATADVRQRLREEIDLDFERTSLDNVLKYISEVKRGFNIVVDPALAQAGTDLSKRVVDLKVKRIPVDEVLDLLLRPDLGYKIEASRVLVTTRDRLPRDLSAVTYRLHEAILRPGGAEAPGALLQAIKQLVNHRAESDIAAWREQGGTASLSLQGGALVITQTARGHERAAELMEKVGGVLDAVAELHDILL